MAEKYKLKMTLEGIELREHELAGIQNPRDFKTKYFLNQNRATECKKIDGKYFWLSGVRMSSAYSLKRNQPPIEVIFIYNNGKANFHMLSKSGEPLQKTINLYDREGNGLHVCETKLQAQYMYNQDLIEQLQIMDSRIRGIEAVKDKLVGLEQKLTFY